jgi:membrane-associated phospholipid phosphatase
MSATPVNPNDYRGVFKRHTIALNHAAARWGKQFRSGRTVFAFGCLFWAFAIFVAIKYAIWAAGLAVLFAIWVVAMVIDALYVGAHLIADLFLGVGLGVSTP